MTTVARPRSFGARTARLTLPTARTRTARASHRSGCRRRMSRFADGPKFIDFSAGMPAVIHGGPPRERASCPAGGSRFGVVVAVALMPGSLRNREAQRSDFVGCSCGVLGGELALDD